MKPVIDHIQITVKDLNLAESRDDVDVSYPQMKDIGVDIVDPPTFYPQHGESYYALFFKDLDGIKYEIVYEEHSFFVWWLFTSSFVKKVIKKLNCLSNCKNN